jgi:hypothetical protein
MTLQELHDITAQMLQGGTRPDTEVVIETGGWYNLIDHVSDPRANEDYDMWVTLFPGLEADSRLTPGHFDEEELPVHDLNPVYRNPFTGEPVAL